MADMTVVTYGGGEFLKNVFDSVAMLFNGGKGGLIQPVMMIAASISAVWAFSKAFFSSSIDALFYRFFLPLLVIPHLLMVPTASVKIEDIIKDKSYKVDNVPLLLAKIAETMSTIGYEFTKKIEDVMHTPNNLTYNKTGMIFGGETSLSFLDYRLTNTALEKNLGRFSRQCVMYDLALGLYSIDDLKKSTDLWGFLKQNTSKVRMIRYVTGEGKQSSKRSMYLNCQEALDKMSLLFDDEKSYYAKHEMFKHLPLTFQALTKVQKTSEELISQQLMMSVLSDEFSPSKFASLRAASQQRSTYETMGSLAGSFTLYARATIESIIYASFVFMAAFALLPGGTTFILWWFKLVIWIQLWPPMFAIINYIMLSAAPTSSESIMRGLSESQCGLSIFTSVGLQDLHANISAMTGYLSASVAVITFGIVQGGFHSFGQIASSMMSPAHSATTTAAAELSSGNLSYSNVSFGQMSHQNTTALQTNTAANLSSGYFTENQGTQSTTYSGNEAVFNQGSSNLIDSINADRVVGENLQKAHQVAETQMSAAQMNFTESVSNHSREMSDLTHHLAQSSNLSQSISEREAVDVQSSARYLVSQAESFGSQYGLSDRQSSEALMSASVSTGVGLGSILPSAHFDGRWNKGVSSLSDEALNTAKNIVLSEDFQTNYQKVQDFAKSTAASSLTDEGARYVDGFTRSLDEVRTSQEQLSNSLTQMNQVSENISWAENNSHSFKKLLNQDFIQWATEKYAYEGGFSKVQEVLGSSNSSEKDALYSEFSQKYIPQGLPTSSFASPSSAFEGGSVPSLSKELERASIQAAASNDRASFGVQNPISTSLNSLESKLNQNTQQMDHKFNGTQRKISESLDQLQTEISDKNEKTHIGRLVNSAIGSSNTVSSPNGPYAKLMGTAVSDPLKPSIYERLTGTGSQNKNENLAGKYQNKEQPFWAQANDAE